MKSFLLLKSHIFIARIACVVSVSVWFRSKDRPRNGILGFGRARNETRSLILVPRSFLLNRTETLATKAIARSEDTFLSFTCEDIGVAMVTNIRFCCYRIFLFFIRILTFWNRKYKYYCLYFSFITLYPSFISFL